MNKKLLNKKVVKKTVKDLKKILKDCDDDAEIILCFNMKDKGVHYCYLAEVHTRLKYDGVIKESLNENHVVELNGYNDEWCTYHEK